MASSRMPIVAVMATLALVALFAARAAGDLASIALLDARLPPSPAAALPPPARSVDRACAILARNVFDSRGPLSCDDEPEVAATTTAPSTTTAPPACDGALRLVGTYVRRDERPPLALVAGASGSQVVTLGDSVDAAVVQRVEMDRIELALEGATCTLEMFRDGGPAPQLVSAVPPAAALDGVRVTGDHVAIDRSAIERAIRDPSIGLARLRAVPTTASDGTAALRLLGIGRDHPLAALGVRSGDLVRAFDGRALDGADAWLEALSIARRPGSHAIDIERAGQRRTLTVDIADR